MRTGNVVLQTKFVATWVLVLANLCSTSPIAAAPPALGDRFDIRAFHDQVLTRGNLTLPLLRELIEEWIASTSRP